MSHSHTQLPPLSPAVAPASLCCPTAAMVTLPFPFTEPILCRECALLNAFLRSSCLGSFPNSVRCDFDLQELLTDLIILESITPLAASLAPGSPPSCSPVSPAGWHVLAALTQSSDQTQTTQRCRLQPQQDSVWDSKLRSIEQHRTARQKPPGKGHPLLGAAVLMRPSWGSSSPGSKAAAHTLAERRGALSCIISWYSRSVAASDLILAGRMLDSAGRQGGRELEQS